MVTAKLAKGALVGAVFGGLALAGVSNAEAAPLLQLDPAPPAYTRVVTLTGSIGGASQTVEASVTVEAYNATQIVVAFSIQNKTPVATVGNNRMVSFGFDVVPDAQRTITGVSDDSSDWGSTMNDNITNGLTVDICAWDGSNCSGGGNQGIGENLTEAFRLTIAGTFNTSAPLSLDNFVARFQAAGPQDTSGVLTTYTLDNPDDPGTDPGSIPEPMTLALFGLGLVGLGAARRRLV